MTNFFKPVDGTFFDTDGKPVSSLLLKRVYENIKQIDLYQRKVQVNRVWNAGRTVYENTDEYSEDSPHGGNIITPNNIPGYQRVNSGPISTTGDRSTTGLRIVPPDLFGSVITVPFYKTRTSNKISIAVSCKVNTASAYMSVGYSLPIRNADEISGPFPQPALQGGINGQYYSSSVYVINNRTVQYTRINPASVNLSFVNTNTAKLLPQDSSGAVTRLVPFEFYIDFNEEGPGLIHLLLAPTWTNNPGTPLPFSINTDSNGLKEYNIIEAIGAKGTGQAYEDLETILFNRTGPKFPLGVRIKKDIDPTNVYYHSLLRAMPKYVSPGNWDPSGLSLMVYPALAPSVVANPTGWSLELVPCTEVQLFAINVREVYEP